MERAMGRVCREAGAVVRPNVMLRDMNVGVQADDQRQIEVLAQGLPCRAGAQLAVDVTLRSCTTARGEPRVGAAAEDRAAARAARADKEAKYPELVSSRRCQLVVVALETGGRWAQEAVGFVREVAWVKAREAAPILRRAAMLGWDYRWRRILATAAANAYAASLIAPAGAVDGRPADGATAFFEDVVGERI